MKLEGVPPTRLEGYQKGGEEGMATEMPQDLRLDSLLRANLAMQGDIDGLRGDVGSLRGDIAELKVRRMWGFDFTWWDVPMLHLLV